MNKIMRLAVCAMMGMACTSLYAQTTETAYFLDGNIYRHDMNPAIGNDKNYVAIPALGNLNVGFGGNMGLKNFLFVKNGQTVTFMHPSVTAQEVMKNIRDNNRMNEELKVQLLSFGFKSGKGYSTFELNVRENVNAIVPGSFFDMAKGGLTNKRYEVKNLSGHGDAFVELALGHSHDINEKLRIGAKLKVLLGAGNADIDLDNAYLDCDENNGITATASGKVQTSAAGLIMKRDEEGFFDGFDFDSHGVGGFGLAVDLGAEYKINDDFKVSAALLDLGFINWKNNLTGSINGTVATSDYTFNMNDGTYTNARGEEIGDAFDAFNIRNEGDKGARTRALGATLNIGGEYKAPFYDKLKFGLLNTTRLQGKYTWTDFRLSANVSPAKWFGAGVSVAAGTYGANVGWIIDFHPKGVGLFIAMDRLLGKLSKQGVPLSSNAELNIGVNVLF